MVWKERCTKISWKQEKANMSNLIWGNGFGEDIYVFWQYMYFYYLGRGHMPQNGILFL